MKLSSYAPIHNHSEYSALDGLATPREIAVRCRDIGCTCCGLTDHATVAGHLEFAKEMVAHDIKPIFGCELYHGIRTEFEKNQRDQAHFVAGALTDEGLRNLWRLVDDASTNFRYVGRVNWDMLDIRKEGLFATSACISGLVSQGIRDGDPFDPLNRYLEIFKDDFYIELHTYPGEEQEQINLELVGIAQERGIPLIYATDAHYASPDQYDIHDTYVAMSTGENTYMDPSERKMWHPKGSLYIQSEDEIRENLSYLPESAVDEALANSGALSERCNASLPEVRSHIPPFIPSESPWMKNDERSAGEVFVELVEQGLINRYGENLPERVWEQATYEMEVMLDAGLEHYLLQTWDFCQFCDENGITRGPGRGSAAGSILCYALGITDVDPLRYDLIFERFWNPGRAKGFPDIDTDFPVNQRKRVREYLMDRWGRDKVRTIGTTMRMKPKATLDKTHKACDVSWDEKEGLKKIVEKTPDLEIHGAETIGWREESDPGKTIYVWDHVGDEIIEWLSKYDEDRIDILVHWLQVIEACCSRVSGYGVHPSGVVVSDVTLNDELPCMWNASQKVQVTCFPMADVDNRKFLKDDLLGLRNLDTLEDWEEQMGEKMDWHALTYEEHPEEMWQLLDQGLTLGIFQIEKGFARQLCKDWKPRSIDDLGVIVAVNRPGPIRALDHRGLNVPAIYTLRRNGDEEVALAHPILEGLLDDTYGLFVYQEQIMRYFGKIGYDTGDTEDVRKILGKKRPEDMRDLRRGEGAWEGKGYMEKALATGMDEDTANLIWSQVEGFASYSFNKAHAICYGTMAFRTLYALWRDAAKNTMACIRTNPDDAGDYVAQGRRMDIDVHPPHIRHSQADIAVLDGEIYFGFSNIKGIGKGAGQYICDLRDTYSICTEAELRAALELEQTQWEEQRDAAKEEGAAFKKKSPRQQLQTNKIDVLEQAGAFDEFTSRDLPLAKVQRLEKELLQVILTDDCEEVFMQYADELSELDTYIDIEQMDEGERVTVPGVVATLTPKKTKKDNKSMGIVTIEYEGDQVEFVVFPREWKSYRFLWKERTPGIFTLVKGDRGIRFDKAKKLT